MNSEFVKRAMSIKDDLPGLYREDRFDSARAELVDLLAMAEGNPERGLALEMIASHFHFVDDCAAAESALNEWVAIEPDEVAGWLGLAEHFHYHQVDLDKAAKYIDIALEKALIKEEFVRQVLGVRIRIALEAGHFDVVSESLEKIMRHRPTKRGTDVAVEDDFIARIPSDRVNADLLKRFEEYVRAKRS